MTPLDIPIDLTREEARRLAEIELADPAYRAAEPSLLARAIQWVVDRITEALDRAADLSPGGWLGIIGLLLLVLAAVIVVRWRLGPMSRSSALMFTVDPEISSAQYRQRAAELAAAGAWDDAIVERMRAIARGAQERGLVGFSVGLTADELADAIAQVRPADRLLLARAARTFDEVRYGGRPGDQGGYELLVLADEVVSGRGSRHEPLVSIPSETP